MEIYDLSHWNKVNDWKKIKDAFIIHKCTQGTSYLDPTYNERKDKIQASYHFADGGDPKKEADWFIKNSNEKMLVLDWEIEHKDPVGWCKTFIERVKEKTGIECWLYTNDARGRKYAFPSKWKKWIARYKDYTGTLDWNYQPKSDWDMWQYTSRGKVDGIEGNVDLNVSKIELKDNTNETIPAPVKEISGDKVEIVEEEVKTPPEPIPEVSEYSGLKYDCEKQALVIEKNWLERLVNKIIKAINDWIAK